MCKNFFEDTTLQIDLAFNLFFLLYFGLRVSSKLSILINFMDKYKVLSYYCLSEKNCSSKLLFLIIFINKYSDLPVHF